MSARAKFGLIALALAVLGGAAAVVVVSVVGDERGPIASVPGGDPDRGAELIEEYGCDTCHTIAGIDSTDKYIGPPLIDFAERRYVAGDEPNRLDVLIDWIVDPQSIEPGTLMPKLGVSPEEARDIAAYLYGH